MTIEVVSFIIGGILVGTAIVGGGFEIKEIKMPRVGAGVRIVSLVVGSGFLLLAMGIWGLNNPQLVAGQVPLNNFAPDADTAGTAPASQPQTRSTADPQQETGAEEQQQVAYPEPEPAAEPGFTGFNGDSQLFWKIDDVEIVATARFTGMGGMIRIGWVDPNTWIQEDVIQDLVLQQDQNGAIYYQGVNPRDAATEQQRPDYSPDQFHVVGSHQQGWTISQICDVQACWPVAVR